LIDKWYADTSVGAKSGATLIETESARITDSKETLVLNTIPRTREDCGRM
jgi:hypothetical protein